VTTHHGQGEILESLPLASQEGCVVNWWKREECGDWDVYSWLCRWGTKFGTLSNREEGTVFSESTGAESIGI